MCVCVWGGGVSSEPPEPPLDPPLGWSGSLISNGHIAGFLMSCHILLLDSSV